MKKRFLAISLAFLLVAGIVAGAAYAADHSFTDITSSDWYYEDVMNAVETGLVNGKTETTFCPNDNLTYAEAIKLAACMNQRYLTGVVTLTNGSPWYQSYVDYALDNGIISKEYDWNSDATRADFMYIFAHALPGDALMEINEVPDGSIPDVSTNYPQAEEIYALYRAGIVQGIDSAHSCNPESYIKRSEVAAILTRMMSVDSRISFMMSTDAALLPIDMSKWQYNAADDVYWQVGIQYCATPVSEEYENLGIFIPGAYMNAISNGDGTYTCTVNSQGTVGSYSSDSAPILFPVNTPGHSAQSAPAGYEKGSSKYTSEGFVYIVAGCRGKDVGAPAGVTDLKAAIRYIRANEELLPGDCERIVAFGMSGGGSQTAVLGATGNSDLYTPYLNAIGAADESDAVAAAMCWCPITGLDSADEGHEWSMGTTRSGLSDEMQKISDSLAAAYANYVNETGFVSEDGNLLLLEESDIGIFQAGSYYDYVKRTIEESLENYLSDTVFPTTGGSGRKSSGASYQTAQDYVDALNADYEWVYYDSTTGKVNISSVTAFSEHCKQATKPVAAFDKLEEGGHQLFNTGDGENTHFDSVLADIISGTAYEAEFAEDFSKTDSVGYTVEERLNMFSP